MGVAILITDGRILLGNADRVFQQPAQSNRDPC
jgi:hypothetical protein